MAKEKNDSDPIQDDLHNFQKGKCCQLSISRETKAQDNTEWGPPCRHWLRLGSKPIHCICSKMKAEPVNKKCESYSREESR